jgi:RNA polymerase sigma-70 factor (ECF subfamily)
MDELPADSTETRRLLEQSEGGDRAAFERLFARHRPDLRRFIARRLDPKLRARLDPSDVVQETQLEAYQRLPDYFRRRPMPFGVWLRKTAYQRLLMLRRQHLGAARRAVGREEPLPDRSSMLLARQFLRQGSTPSQQLARREMARRVRQAVAQLPEDDREILLMRTFERLSYQEAACILGVDAAAARKRHGRALLRLHRLLADAGLEDAQP